jgi:hypothetical protein
MTSPNLDAMEAVARLDALAAILRSHLTRDDGPDRVKLASGAVVDGGDGAHLFSLISDIEQIVTGSTSSIIARIRELEEQVNGSSPDHALSDVRPSTRPEGWQPIETAPRDGEHVLLFGILKHDQANIGFWYDGEWWSWCHPRLPMGPGGNPTHWQPLPAPPAARPHD